MRRSAIGLLMLAACTQSSTSLEPSSPPTPRLSSEPSSSTATIPGISECQEAAQQGLNTLLSSVQLAKEQITVEEHDQQFRGVYIPADSACLDFLANESTFDARLEACEKAGHFASETGYHVIGTLVADTKKERNRHKREGLSAIRQAGANWRICFPGEAIPEGLQL